MRRSPVHDVFARAGTAFRDRYGIEVPAQCAGRAAEYRAIREAVGLTDFSFLRIFRVPEETGLDLLDLSLAGNVPKVRFGRVLHTFLADEQGHLLADCYVANNDQEFLLLCESAVPDADLDAQLLGPEAAAAGLEDLTSTHAVLSVDGFKAWQVVRKLFGPDVLGLPYLSIENYTFEGAPVRLIRAGKTSEFGYLLIVPSHAAGALADRLAAEVAALGGSCCGVDIHDDLRLEGRFFNIHQEGRQVRDPLVLGLQWMIDFDKESFSGREAIHARRASGLREKIIGIAAEPGGAPLAAGAALYLAGHRVAEVVTSGCSEGLNRWLGLAVLPAEVAFAGLSFCLGAPDGPEVRSISMPPILSKSLTVKLDEQ